MSSVYNEYVRDPMQEKVWDEFKNKRGEDAAKKASEQQMAAMRESMAALTESYGAGRGYLEDIYGENKGVFDPYMQTGMRGQEGQFRALGDQRAALGEQHGAIRSMTDLIASVRGGPGEFTESPGYQFMRDEGLNTVQRQASNRRSPYGSAATRSMLDFSSGLASQEYGNFFQRWMQQQGMNLTGAQGLVSGYGSNAAGYGSEAAGYGGIAQRGLQAAGGKAGFASNIGKSMAGMYGAEGQTMADLWTQLGNAQAAGTMGESNARRGPLDYALPIVVGYAASSDVRLKRDIQPLDGKAALELVLSLKPVTWVWIANGEASAGVIAQELREVAPRMVKEAEDGTLMVDYGALTGYLLAAVHELAARE